MATCLQIIDFQLLLLHFQTEEQYTMESHACHALVLETKEDPNKIGNINEETQENAN